MNHKVHHPRCVLKQTRIKRMYLSNTTLFDGRDICRIYYIKHNYMLRLLTMVIFRLYMKYLVSSYTRLMWAVYSEEVTGEVGTKSRMCYGKWAVWVHGDSITQRFPTCAPRSPKGSACTSQGLRGLSRKILW